ncbi:MAG: polyribonucleotide nucleotidyltransferase, partial [Bacteroidales bacterium]|nr:polyribonucleotide nucleotidyltransferase [Bacteroidales bacterium]
MNVITKKIELPDGRVIEIETGKLAKQAAGSAVVKMGGTMLLATVTAADEVKEGTDFLPLSVDYREKYYSAGRFPGGFLKREGKADDYEVLIARLVDRPIRPLWPDDFHLEVFIYINLISADKDTQPDALAGLAASAALASSDLPFGGPVSEVRICRIDGQWRINPGFSEMAGADIDMMVAATEENIMMVEGELNEVSEHDMLEAIKVAHEEIKKHCRVQKELMHELGTDVNKRDYPHDVQDEDLRKAVRTACYDRCYALAKSASPKKAREDGFKAIKEEFLATIPEEELEEKTPLVERYYAEVEKEAMRNMILDEGVRLDGRSTAEVRPIWCETDVLPCAHGSAVFTRGETQSLATVTLGTKMDMKENDEVLIQGDQQFVLHYNFPPFATGEAKAQRAPGRREIGHGNLAMRALKAVVPMAPENPYAVRVVSDILESNGSSSMASVCGGCLALMD